MNINENHNESHNENHNENYNEKYNENYYDYNNTAFFNNDDAYFINCLFGLSLFFFLLISCTKSIINSRNHINDNDNNQRLINNTSSSEINTENIEKIEKIYIDELYDKECTICLENFNENEILYELKCKHYYHKTCIDDWLSKKRTCPLCRLNLL